MGDALLGTIAFLFTDIEGSTEMLRAQPDSYGLIVAQHAGLVREAVAAHGGTARDTEGDSFFCTFPTVGAAASAAYQAQQALLTHPFPHGGPVWVRMGIHVGAASDHDGEITGLAIHYAARIAAAGHGGQILLSSAARAIASEELPRGTWTLDLGRHRVKDFPEPEHLYQLAADDLPSEFVPLKTQPDRSDNLPVALTSFVGRGAQLVEVVDLLDGNRLVTLVGPGGTGKTRMALEVAGRLAPNFEDGTWLVELAGVAADDQVDSALASALGVREGSSGTVAPSADWAHDRTLRQRMIEALRTRRTFVVLDNCEHVVPACSALITEVLRSCPDVTVLATSQRQLGVPGEITYRVPPLELPDEGASTSSGGETEAVRLFMDRAIRRCPGLELDDAGMGAVAAICRKLDGLAYAIELAAARVAVLSPVQILGFLEDQPSFLGSGSAGGRHQTLRAALDWSYGLLSDKEQRLLRHLAVFPDSFDFDAARAVADPDPTASFEVLDQLTSLAESSLIETQTESAVVRYRLLEGTRQYALEKLAAQSEEGDALDRHAGHYAALAEAAEPTLRRHGLAESLDRVEAELDNLTAALDHLCAVATGDTAVRLASGLWHFFVVRGFLSEGRQHLARALKSSPAADVATVALATARVASLALFDGDSDDAARLATEALDLAGTADGTVPARISALLTLGLVDLNRSRRTEAARREEEALALSAESGDDWSAAYAHNNLGNVALADGNLERAAEHYASALELRRGLGDAWGTAWTLYRVGALATFAGRTDDARRALVEGCDLSSSIRFDQGRVLCLLGLGDAAQADGDDDVAVQAYEDALAGADDLEDPTVAAIALAGLVVTAVQARDASASRRHLNDARLDVIYPFLLAFRLRAAGLLAALEGDAAEARALLAEGLTIRAELADLRRIAEGLDDLAVLLVGEDPDRAARLASAALAVRNRVGAILPAARRPIVEAVHDSVRDQPGWIVGAEMSLEEAVALAVSP